MNNLIKAAKDVLKRYDRDDGVINLHSDGDLVEALRKAVADHIPNTGKMVSETNEPLPCPFCGGEAVINDFRVRFSVDCTRCHAWINGERADEFHAEPSAEYVEYLRQSAIQAWNTRVKPPFHPSQLFTKGTTGDFMVSGYTMTFDDGELVNVRNVAWHPSISDYETLKQQFDELLQALYVENVHSNRNGYFIPNTERILELNGRDKSPYEGAYSEVNATAYEILKQERDRYRKALVDIADLSRWDMQTSYEEIEKVSANNGAWIDAEYAHGIINEALKD